MSSAALIAALQEELSALPERIAAGPVMRAADPAEVAEAFELEGRSRQRRRSAAPRACWARAASRSRIRATSVSTTRASAT